jgi:2-dehydro-3-deoxy-D-arabinonate dehydratase
VRYYRLDDGSEPRLVARRDGEARDLTAAKPGLATLTDLARAADLADATLDGIAERHLADAPSIDPDRLDAEAGLPLEAAEVWAAGVTYAISEEAREAESSMPEMYLDVYDADRPEIFFKATPSRTVGPGEAVGIRADSEWDTPEPELGVVVHRGETVGFTVGNDMSSRDIEGANPLYLPQAKVYDRCCSIGPCVASTGTIEDPHDLRMDLEIRRDGEVAFEDATSTGEMVRTCEDLVDWLARSNPLPETAVLLTGTALVPPEEFTLRPGDEVVIDVESIGRLRNPVVEV